MVIQFCVGVYVIVRGLANIEDAQKAGPLTVKTLLHLMFSWLRRISQHIKSALTHVRSTLRRKPAVQAEGTGT